jgi:hypothetical protein
VPLAERGADRPVKLHSPQARRAALAGKQVA